MALIITTARMLAILALVCVILSFVMPPFPWLAVAVGLLALAFLV